MSQISVLIIDDHEVVRLGLRSLIDSHSDMRVVAEGGTAKEAITLAEHHNPDVVVLDIRLPDRSGLDVCSEIRQKLPNIRVIILTSYIQEELVSEAMRSGANGYVLKDVGNESLIRAIRAAMQGEIALDSQSASRLAERFRVIDSQLEGFAFQGLSPREMDVLRIVAEGKSNKEIGGRLNLSEITIRNYVSTILDKLGLANRIELALYAVKHKLSMYPKAME